MNNIHIAPIGVLIALCFVNLVISDVSHLHPLPVQQQLPLQQQQQAPAAGNNNRNRILFALFIFYFLELMPILCATIRLNTFIYFRQKKFVGFVLYSFITFSILVVKPINSLLLAKLVLLFQVK